MAIDRFTKKQFEDSLAEHWKFKSLGLIRGQEVYRVDINSPHVVIMVYSSIDSTGIARDNAKDSIRAIMATHDNKSLGGKVQTYVTRQKNWRTNLFNMMLQMKKLACWVQPCPECGQMLILKVTKGKDVYLFCPEDLRNKDNPNHDRHVALHIIDFKSGALIKHGFVDEPQEDVPTCPTCNINLQKVTINKGINKGKMAWTCPAKDGNIFLNHFFEVIQEEEEDSQEDA